MSFLFFLAVLNGMIINVNRLINGQLSTKVGALKASFWNHIVGFIFLTIIVFILGDWFLINENIPKFAYLGSVFGAFFGAINSYVILRIGAMNTTILIICGQIITAILLDIQLSGKYPSYMQITGIIFILFAVYLSKVQRFSINWNHFKKAQ
ncbi:DMT family transporter [Fluviispira sanaruensis]|uniref:DMT family transporter n=1 Tax=Fluviispira sanaruensis TaxID=2493639 RepID=A0A4P2VKZ1_FLUSA|nr:DMT family transporter [Fluviispira sanaruensis]BBH51999.1 DMT family transporter [Fluviispira sanaruensis]